MNEFIANICSLASALLLSFLCVYIVCSIIDMITNRDDDEEDDADEDNYKGYYDGDEWRGGKPNDADDEETANH